MNTLPQRIKPEKTYPVGKAARQDLGHYLYSTGQMDAYIILHSEQYRDYDWTELMEQSGSWWQNETKRRIENSLDNTEDF